MISCCVGHEEVNNNDDDETEWEEFHDLFPYRFHQLLSEVEAEGLTDIVSWLPCGTYFRVHDIPKFTKQVMPRIGRFTQYKSFLRQLSMYKFERITSGPLKGSYRHPYFRKNHIDLCRGVLRGEVYSGGDKSTTGSITATTSHSKEAIHRKSLSDSQPNEARICRAGQRLQNTKMDDQQQQRIAGAMVGSSPLSTGAASSTMVVAAAPWSHQGSAGDTTNNRNEMMFLDPTTTVANAVLSQSNYGGPSGGNTGSIIPNSHPGGSPRNDPPMDIHNFMGSNAGHMNIKLDQHHSQFVPQQKVSIAGNLVSSTASISAGLPPPPGRGAGIELLPGGGANVFRSHPLTSSQQQQDDSTSSSMINPFSSSSSSSPDEQQKKIKATSMSTSALPTSATTSSDAGAANSTLAYYGKQFQQPQRSNEGSQPQELGKDPTSTTHTRNASQDASSGGVGDGDNAKSPSGLPVHHPSRADIVDEIINTFSSTTSQGGSPTASPRKQNF